ncbi:hypothetical protein BDZ89DRAFT_1114889 [Hymenopellis radicata]|nr:hypothetical protein BDZ89DRAFT_1114889 [Hymenopellis radicata]
MALLVPANAAGIVPPLAPALSPTVADARAAQEYSVKVYQSHQSGAPGTATNADVVAAAEYEHSILSQRGAAAAPPWFAAVQAQLNRIEDRLGTIESRLGKVSNATNGSGHTYTFDVINFNNNAPVNSGVDPTTIGLPALTSITPIDNLTHAQVNRYCQGYGLAVGGPYRQRKRAIARHIGCHDLGVLL